MNSIYFEEKGEALLERLGMPKAEFARRMGIQRQNVKALFKSKDLRVIQRAADVMGVPWIFLVGYAEEPDVYQLPIPSYEEFLDFARQYPGEYDVPEAYRLTTIALGCHERCSADADYGFSGDAPAPCLSTPSASPR